MVWDANTRSMRHYLDGHLLYDTADYFSAGGLPRVDAVLPRGAKEVAGIGQGGFVGGMAQMRMYKSVWTEGDIREYHTMASASGVTLRECKPADEYADDTAWSDVFGHSCSWFAVARKHRPETQPCAQVAASAACPVACGSVTACWEGRTESQNSESARMRLQHLGMDLEEKSEAGGRQEKHAWARMCLHLRMYIRSSASTLTHALTQLCCVLYLTPQICRTLRTGPIRTNTSVCTAKSVDRAAVLAACRLLPSEQRYLPATLQNAWLYSLLGTSTLQGQMTQKYRSQCPEMLLPGTISQSPA